MKYTQLSLWNCSKNEIYRKIVVEILFIGYVRYGKRFCKYKVYDFFVSFLELYHRQTEINVLVYKNEYDKGEYQPIGEKAKFNKQSACAINHKFEWERE